MQCNLMLGNERPESTEREGRGGSLLFFEHPAGSKMVVRRSDVRMCCMGIAVSDDTVGLVV